ncbi:hypothetical protein [Gloeobacter kilaueensis]|uniref:Uncharacterized protein n=1 Tax=Gloeobacter kilaueensis (strain ATCC BAA-2537 / CCAP 1431/1 / ULC 316 / JS1) TaxID=1183438 RepID=U5QFV8_GLOK1|nr:hypothetical protein [Gloeobacter kilaueensis]AGY57778.1 hypothetical protein GKIL_1532 [Gloeobacter kilaueensis JS1]
MFASSNWLSTHLAFVVLSAGALLAVPSLADEPVNRCRASALVRLEIESALSGRAYIEVDRESSRTDTLAQELEPGQIFVATGCSDDRFLIRVFTARACGKQFVGQSEALRVEGGKTVKLEPNALFERLCRWAAD